MVPRKRSAPGFVKISTRPYPSLSYSGENGFWFTRTSRMDCFDGNSPPLNPSTKIEPPLGPADGPAKACRSVARSSGSSESACRSSPRNTTALALLDASVLTIGHAVSWTVTGCGGMRSRAEPVTEYSAGAIPGNEYAPLSSVIAASITPFGPLSVTLALATAAPDSSVTCPCNLAVCAKSVGANHSTTQKWHKILICPFYTL